MSNDQVSPEIERIARHWIEKGRTDAFGNPDPGDWEHIKANKPIAYSQAIHVATWALSIPPAPQPNVSCPCTLIEQDEECPVGYPSMICGLCKGIGNTAPEQVAALACEMIKIASDIGEPEDPFAAWESIDLIKSQHGQLRKELGRIADMLDAEDADLDDAISIASAALAATATEDGR